MSNNDNYAPTFDVARNTLAGMLDGWVFGRVMRSVTQPDPSKPYFHGMIVTPRGARVWFQQSSAAGLPLMLGPLTVLPCRRGSPLPEAGDVLMGKLDSSTKGEKRSARLMSWFPNARQLQVLAKVCLSGTNKHELQLLGDMRSDNDDDIWGLCRLVMFGNIKAFADAHMDNPTCQMRLTRKPIEFVYSTAELLGDRLIWEKFLELVPDAELPPTEEEKREGGRAKRAFMPCYTPAPRPSQVYHPDEIQFQASPSPLPTPPPPKRTWVQKEAAAAYGGPQSPPFCPSSSPFTQITPPDSPPYCPSSPPYSPSSPPYSPSSPPYIPITPPDSPLYCSSSPPNSPITPPDSPLIGPSTPQASAPHEDASSPPGPISPSSEEKVKKASDLLKLLSWYTIVPSASSSSSQAYDPMQVETLPEAYDPMNPGRQGEAYDPMNPGMQGEAYDPSRSAYNAVSTQVFTPKQ